MEDTRDLKSLAERRVGSSPTSSTIYITKRGKQTMSILLCLSQESVLQIQNRIREHRFHALFVKTGKFAAPLYTIYVFNKAMQKVVGVMTLDYTVSDTFSAFLKRFTSDGWDKKSGMSKAAFSAQFMICGNRRITALGIRDFISFKKPLSLVEFNERYNVHVKKVPAFYCYVEE